MTRKNMIRLKTELNEFCIPATIPLSCSATASWNSCEMARSDNHSPRRDVTIPAKRRPMEMKEKLLLLLVVGSAVVFALQFWFGDGKTLELCSNTLVLVGVIVAVVGNATVPFVTLANDGCIHDEFGRTE